MTNQNHTRATSRRQTSSLEPASKRKKKPKRQTFYSVLCSTTLEPYQISSSLARNVHTEKRRRVYLNGEKASTFCFCFTRERERERVWIPRNIPLIEKELLSSSEFARIKSWGERVRRSENSGCCGRTGHISPLPTSTHEEKKSGNWKGKYRKPIRWRDRKRGGILKPWKDEGKFPFRNASYNRI